MRGVLNRRGLIHGQVMFCIGSEFHGLLVWRPPGYPISCHYRFDDIGIDLLIMGGFTGNIDHFAEEVEEIVFVREGIQADAASIFLPNQVGQGIYEY